MTSFSETTAVASPKSPTLCYQRILRFTNLVDAFPKLIDYVINLVSLIITIAHYTIAPACSIQLTLQHMLPFNTTIPVATC